MRGVFTCLKEQHFVTSWFWREFLTSYEQFPYDASMAWVTLCVTWQRQWGLFN